MVFTRVHHDRIRGIVGDHLAWWLTMFVSSVLVFIASHWVLTSLPKPFNYRKAAVKALSDKTEILGLGSSHIYVMMDPESFSRPTMNLSSDAFNFRVVESVLSAYLDSLSGLKVVLIEWDFVPFVYDTLHVYKTDFRRYLDFEPDLSSLDETPWKLARLHWDTWRQDSALSGPFFAADKLTPGVILDVLRGVQPAAGNPDQVVKAGYTGLLGELIPERLGDKRLAVHLREAMPAQVEANFQALQRIMRELERRKIRVALVRFPHHESYWKIQPKEWESMLAGYLHKLRQEFGEQGFEVWDFEREPGMGPEDFYDADHLNVQGNKKLVPLLEERIKSNLSR